MRSNAHGAARFLVALLLATGVALAQSPAQSGPRGKPATTPKSGAKPKASATPAPPSFACEEVKERLAGAANRCSEQARAAASIPCSATGHSKLLALDLACAQQSDPKGAKKAPLAAEVKSGTCRALAISGGALIAEAEMADYQACARAVAADVVASRCKAGVEKVEYLFLRGGQEPFATSTRCPGAP